MSALHAMQAESEIFRRGECQNNDEEEADFEEYQRRMRAAAKSKAPPVRKPQKAAAPREPEASSSVRTTLENEHEQRLEARARLEEREHRHDAVVSESLTSDSVNPSEPVTLAEMRGALKANERAMQEDTVEFVGAYR